MTLDGWLGILCLALLILSGACWFVGSRKASSSDYDTRIWGSGE